MTTPTHDPLTAKHREILDRAPFEMSIGELGSSGDQQGVHFLQQLGYLAATPTHVSEDPAKNRYRWERTAKAID